MKSSADSINHTLGIGPLLEARALLEVTSCFASMPLLKLFSPKGDGHPVLALPAFLSNDSFMNTMLKYLQSLGYDAFGWGHGRNTGYDESKFTELVRLVERTAKKTNRKVSLVGHSLGGIYARLIAHEVPDAVRQVVYLGAPFNIEDDNSTELPVRWLYEKMNGAIPREDFTESGLGIGATTMPSTAIYSMSDGIVPWQFCVDEEDEISENVRITGSHVGMPFNPLILYAIADRLSQAEDNWKPFAARGLWRQLYDAQSS